MAQTQELHRSAQPPQPQPVAAPRHEIRLTAFEKWIHSSTPEGSGGGASTPRPRAYTRSPSAHSNAASPDAGRAGPLSPAPVVVTPSIVFSTTNLPPTAMVEKSVDSFYNMASTLWFVMPRDECEEILRSLYWTPYPSMRSNARLVELCALVSVGAQYHLDPATQAFRHLCMQTVKLHMDELIEDSELRAMRVYELSCLFYITEKRTTAWAYVAAGLRIAEHFGLENEQQKPNSAVPMVSEAEWTKYRKNWRTLRHLESWLTGSLGRFIPRAINDDLDFIIEASSKYSMVHTPYVVDTNLIQCEFTKVSLISAELLRAASSSPVLSLPSLYPHIHKLDQWLANLPAFMQIEYMIHNDGEPTARNNILLVHLVYLGARVILARRILVESPRIGATHAHRDHIEEGVNAAILVHRIVGMLLENKQIFRRCWLAIHESLSSISLLLYHATQLKLLSHPYADYVNHARVLLDALQHCSGVDTIAERYVRLLQPYFDTFAAMESHDANTMEMARETAEELRDILRMPFDGPVKELMRGGEKARSVRGESVSDTGSVSGWVAGGRSARSVSAGGRESDDQEMS